MECDVCGCECDECELIVIGTVETCLCEDCLSDLDDQIDEDDDE